MGPLISLVLPVGWPTLGSTSTVTSVSIPTCISGNAVGSNGTLTPRGHSGTAFGSNGIPTGKSGKCKLTRMSGKFTRMSMGRSGKNKIMLWSRSRFGTPRPHTKAKKPS